MLFFSAVNYFHIADPRQYFHYALSHYRVVVNYYYAFYKFGCVIFHISVN